MGTVKLVGHNVFVKCRDMNSLRNYKLLPLCHIVIFLGFKYHEKNSKNIA